MNLESDVCACVCIYMGRLYIWEVDELGVRCVSVCLYMHAYMIYMVR